MTPPSEGPFHRAVCSSLPRSHSSQPSKPYQQDRACQSSSACAVSRGVSECVTWERMRGFDGSIFCFHSAIHLLFLELTHEWHCPRLCLPHYLPLLQHFHRCLCTLSAHTSKIRIGFGSSRAFGIRTRPYRKSLNRSYRRPPGGKVRSGRLPGIPMGCQYRSQDCQVAGNRLG